MDQTLLQPAATGLAQANISGEVSGQVAVGSYILQIGSVHGGVVNINLPEQKPRVKARPTPVYILPRRFAGLLDRLDELGVASTALPASQPVEFHAQSGTGKTSLLRVLARHPLAIAFPDGVIFLSARGQAPADLQQSIFDALFEYDAPYKPSEGEIRYALQNKRVLILLDDVELGREELELLFDAAPESTFLFASPERKLWREGLSLALPGLPLQEALRLLERELGRELSEAERASMNELCTALEGHPLALMQAAALIREYDVPLQSLAVLAHEEQPKRKIAGYAFGLLSQPESLAVAAIAALNGAPLSSQHLPALTGVPKVNPVLTGLQKRGLIQKSNSGYTLAGSFSGIVLGAWDLAPWRDRLLDYFQTWVTQQLKDPQGILDEIEAILRLIESAGNAADWRGVLNLVKAVEGTLALSCRWGAWEQMLQRGLEAAEALGDLRAKAWAMHQLGTRLLGLDEKQAARRLLVRALRLREMVGDRAGADVTRHNLSLLFGPPGSDDPGSPKGPARPATSVYKLPVGVLSTLLVAGVIAVIVWFALQIPWAIPPAVPPPVQPPVPVTQPPAETIQVLPITGAEFRPTSTSAVTATEIAVIETATPTPTEVQQATPETQARMETPVLVTAPCAPQLGWPVYSIRRGDTLWSIANASGSTAEELRLANCLPDSRILAGQPLFVPRLPVYTPVLTITPSLTSTVTPTFTPTVPALPDLVITSLQVSLVSLLEAESSPAAVFNLPVSVTIFNQGGQVAGPFQVRVYLRGDYPKTYYAPPPAPLTFAVESLAPGASRTFEGAFVAPALGYARSLVAWAIADDCGGEAFSVRCQVAESNEDNNQSADQLVLITNYPPAVNLTEPDREVTLTFSGSDESGWYREVVLRGAGSDPEDGALPGDRLTWTSDVSGYLGSGDQLSVRLYAGLCEGVTHTITLVATDSQGAQSAATRQVTLRSESDCRPKLEVELPQAGDFYVGENVSYQGEQKYYYLNIDGIAIASDALDRPITGSLVWTVDGIGQVGTGGKPSFLLYLLDHEDICDEAHYSLQITATDAAGNQTEKVIPIELIECSPLN